MSCFAVENSGIHKSQWNTSSSSFVLSYPLIINYPLYQNHVRWNERFHAAGAIDYRVGSMHCPPSLTDRVKRTVHIRLTVSHNSQCSLGIIVTHWLLKTAELWTTLWRGKVKDPSILTTPGFLILTNGPRQGSRFKKTRVDVVGKRSPEKFNLMWWQCSWHSENVSLMTPNCLLFRSGFCHRSFCPHVTNTLVRV